MEKDIHVILVQEIEKYPVLYNYKLAEYSRKDVTERTWSEISNKIHLSVNDCKEKWRNIRSTFLRSLKTPPSGSKPKKPYYLKDYLSFILPYVKPVNALPNPGNIPSIEESTSEPIDADTEDQATNAPTDDSQDTVQSQDSIQEDAGTPETSRLHGARRKRNNNEVDTAMVQFLKNKIEKKDESKRISKKQSVMNHFFFSLEGEFDDMTDQQLRSLKIKVLQLIDDIKHDGRISTPSTCTGSTYYSQQLSAYSPISSATTRDSTDAPVNCATECEPAPTPSPVHTPYNFSAAPDNLDIEFSYTQM